MKNILYLISFFICALCFAQSDECINIHKINDWNYALCLGDGMQINPIAPAEKQIAKIQGGDRSLSQYMTFKLSYNQNAESAKELWDSKIGSKSLNINFISERDSSYTVDGNDFYWAHRVFMDEESNSIMTLSSAIVRYKAQYYSFETLGVHDENRSYEFLMEVLNASSFYGNPVLKDDQKAKEELLDVLIRGIQDESLLEQVLISFEILLSIMPEELRNDSMNDDPKTKELIKMQQGSVYAYAKEMRVYEKVTVESADIRMLSTQGEMSGYAAYVVFNCDGIEIGYNFSCFNIKNKMYVGRMVKYE